MTVCMVCWPSRPSDSASIRHSSIRRRQRLIFSSLMSLIEMSLVVPTAVGRLCHITNSVDVRWFRLKNGERKRFRTTIEQLSLRGCIAQTSERKSIGSVGRNQMLAIPCSRGTYSCS
jgi:hypothetical protein